MPRRLALPTIRASLGIPTESNPTLARARERLGGKASSHRDAGSVVTVADASGKPALGIVLCGDADTCDVWLETGFLKRTRRDGARPVQVAPEPSSPLARIGNDAMVFAALEEGQRVRFEPPGKAPQVGLLLEKCRYGALIATDAGAVFAVGFRRVWPLTGADEAS